MKIAVFAVLLAVMQAAPLMPRKATDQKTPTSRKNKRAPQEKPQPDAPQISQPVKAPTESHVAPANNPQTMIIRESAPVSRWEKAYVIFTAFLVVIGAAGVWAAYKTLKGVKEQVTEMTEQRKIMDGQLATMKGQLESMKGAGEQTEKLIEHAEHQAEALLSQTEATQLLVRATIQGVEISQKSTDSLKTAERPWLFLRPTTTYFPHLKPNRLDWKMVNLGRTVATVIEVGLTCKKVRGMGQNI